MTAERPLNRQERRALARKQLRVPMIRVQDLSLPEAELAAEAFDAYLIQMDDETPAAKRTPEQHWAYSRAMQLREMFQAAVDNRPSYDEHGQREP